MGPLLDAGHQVANYQVGLKVQAGWFPVPEVAFFYFEMRVHLMARHCKRRERDERMKLP